MATTLRCLCSLVKSATLERVITRLTLYVHRSDVGDLDTLTADEVEYLLRLHGGLDQIVRAAHSDDLALVGELQRITKIPRPGRIENRPRCLSEKARLAQFVQLALLCISTRTPWCFHAEDDGTASAQQTEDSP